MVVPVEDLDRVGEGAGVGNGDRPCCVVLFRVAIGYDLRGVFSSTGLYDRPGAVGLLTHVLCLVPVLFLSRRSLVKSADHPYRCPLPLSPNCNTQSRRSFRSPVRSLKALKALKTQETHGKRRVDKVAGRCCNRAWLKADLDGLVGAERRLLDGHVVVGERVGALCHVSQSPASRDRNRLGLCRARHSVWLYDNTRSHHLIVRVRQ